VWDAWYDNLPTSIHTKRLDSIGFRLLELLALTNDKDCIDLTTVNAVVRILEYEFAVRTLTDPIDADGQIARLEEAIRRQLNTRGPLGARDLRRFTQADRHGVWCFKTAINNLTSAQDIRLDGNGKYRRLSSDLSSAPQNLANPSSLLEI